MYWRNQKAAKVRNPFAALSCKRTLTLTVAEHPEDHNERVDINRIDNAVFVDVRFGLEMELLIEEVFEEMEKAAQLTMWEELESSIDLEEFIDERDESGFLLGLVGFNTNLSQAREVKIARQDAVLLALAIHRFKRSEGEWPTKLDQLLGKWIDRTPIDRLNGKPLHFVIKDDAPVVYSLGHDDDDDGGVNTDSDAPWLDRNSDGDWILWPSND